MPTQQEFDRYFLELICQYDNLRFLYRNSGLPTETNKDRVEVLKK